MKTKYLVLGGGFAGWSVAQKLGKLRLDTILVSEENYTTFQPMLPEVVGGELSPMHVVTPLREICKNVTVMRGNVISIDIPNKTVTVKTSDHSDSTISYEELILALGSKVDLSRTPGMQEHAFLLQNAMDATRIRNEVLTKLEAGQWEKDKERRTRLLSFTIVGGGYSGVEVAGQILDLVRDLKRTHPNINPEDVSVSLIHSSNQLLPMLEADLGTEAAACMVKRGLKLHLNHRVKAVTSDMVYASTKSGELVSFPSNTVICTIGLAPNPLTISLSKVHSIALQENRFPTDSFGKVTLPTGEHFHAIGDCALVPYTVKGVIKFCPPTAQYAVRLGAWLASNFARIEKGVPAKIFTFGGLGELATVGHHQAVGKVFGISIKGFFCWWLWRTVYLSKLPGWHRKLKVCLEWSVQIFAPRNTSVVSPRYSKITGTIHLEKGNTLFSAGEPAFSLYIVKSGKLSCTRTDNATAIVTEGGTMGYNTLLRSNKDELLASWDYTAVALEPTEIITLTRDSFYQITPNLKVIPPKFI